MSGRGLLGAFEELVLLGVARVGAAPYGMTVRREIEKCTGRDVAIGAVYATLDRLETKGLVHSSLGESDTSRKGRARRYFSLTREGVSALERTRTTRAGLWEGLDLEELASGADGTR